jgi:hypothetical protein
MEDWTKREPLPNESRYNIVDQVGQPYMMDAGTADGKGG